MNRMENMAQGLSRFAERASEHILAAPSRRLDESRRVPEGSLETLGMDENEGDRNVDHEEVRSIGTSTIGLKQGSARRERTLMTSIARAGPTGPSTALRPRPASRPAGQASSGSCRSLD